jgi:succinyl-CoA synthetase beta subunit
LGIDLTVDEVIAWIKEKNWTTVTIGKTTWTLHTFLAEPMIPHEEEYYVSFETTRSTDRVNFTTEWWVEIEEVWERVKSIEVAVSDWLCHSERSSLSRQNCGKESFTVLWDSSVVPPSEWQSAMQTVARNSSSTTYNNRNSIDPLSARILNSQDAGSSPAWRLDNLLHDLSKNKKQHVSDFVTNLVVFARNYWFTYLEVNPFVIQDGIIHCLDMVAKIDTCEAWKQNDHWHDLKIVKPFGTITHPLELKIDQLDAESYASVQFRSMNPSWSIGLLLWWWWASVIVMDTLARLWMIDQVINYGDLSWNPSYWDNKAYIEWLVDLMLQNTHHKQYLCYMGWIANFTKIDVFCDAYIDALTPRLQQLKEKNIHCIIRRWWPGDTQWLKKIETFLSKHEIPHRIADGDEYLTDILSTILLS